MTQRSRGWEEDCVKQKQREGWSEDRARAYCWGARHAPCLYADGAGIAWADALRYHRALYAGDPTAAYDACRMLWAQYIEQVRDGRLFLDADIFDAAVAEIAAARGVTFDAAPISRPSVWVHNCIREYMKKGMSREEASQRCYGAWHKQHPGESTKSASTPLTRSAPPASAAMPQPATSTGLSRTDLTLRDDVDGLLHGYLAVWGSEEQRDMFGTWFDQRKPPEMALEYLPFPLMYEHTADGQFQKKIIGRVFEVGYDDIGVWYLARLRKDKLNPQEFDRLVEEMRAGKLATSTASAEHIADFDDAGRFVEWILSEVSLTKSPAEPRMPAVSLLRSGALPQPRLFQPLSQSLLSSQPPPQRDLYTALMPTVPAGPAPGAGAGSVASEPSSVDAPGLTLAPGVVKKENDTERTTMELQDLLSPAALDAGVSAADILDALIAEFGLDAVEELFAQMKAPAPEAGAPTAAPAMAADMLSAPNDAGGTDAPAGDAVVTDPAAATAAVVEEMRHLLAQRKRDREVDVLRKQVEDMARARQTTPPPAVPRPSPDRRVRTPVRIDDVMDLRFDHLDAADLATGYVILRAAHGLDRFPGRRPNDVVSESYLRAMAYKATRAAERQPDGFYGRMAVTRALPWMRADELMGSDVVAAGDEWVGILYENQLWEKTRQATIYQAALGKGMQERTIPQGVESVYIPTEGSDPTVYTVAQTDDVNATTNLPDSTGITVSKPGTGRVQLTINKLGIYNAFTGEFEEDSLIPVIADLRRRQGIAAQEAISYILIRGDTETADSTNINDIAGTPAGTERFLHSNGWLKRALVTQTANSRSAEGTLDEEDYQKLFSLMGTNGIEATDPTRLLFIVDNFTYWATMRLVAIKTDDVRASGGTVNNGVLESMWGVDLLRSGQMEKVNSAGKYDADTAANNAYGLIVCVRPDKWTVGWKRRVTTEITRYAEADASSVVTWLRFGQQGFNNELVAVTYYVGV